MIPRPRHRSLHVAAALVAGLAGAAFSPAPSRADEAADVAEVAAGDAEGDCPGELDVWVASTRRLPDVCEPPPSARFDVERLVGAGQARHWEPADLGLLLGEPHRPLVVFVHGNRYAAADAKSQGLILARRLAERRPLAAPRLVIFSWPSQKQGLPLKDGRRKYDRAHADGHYLAALLGRAEPEQSLALVGYSFGALLIAEALRDLDGIEPGGLPWAERPGRTHLVFVAPAIRCDALAPRGPFQAATVGLDRFTLLINSRDEALRFFPLVEPEVHLPALGFVGMPGRWLPAEVEYAATDVASIIGKRHTMRHYLESRPITARIAGGALDGLSGE